MAQEIKTVKEAIDYLEKKINDLLEEDIALALLKCDDPRVMESIRFLFPDEEITS